MNKEQVVTEDPIGKSILKSLSQIDDGAVKESIPEEMLYKSEGSQTTATGNYSRAEGAIRYAEESNDVRETVSVGSARDVKIVTLNSGYLVRVGCQSIAVETTETLMTRLAEYLDNPNAFESKWFSNDKRNKL